MRGPRSSRRFRVIARDQPVAALRRMSKSALLQGMNLCLRNARSLLREAEVLAQARAMSRAFMLAVLVQEEAGKVVLLTLMSHGDRSEADDRTLRAPSCRTTRNSRCSQKTHGKRSYLCAGRRSDLSPSRSHLRYGNVIRFSSTFSILATPIWAK